ncbi:hypothetical protein BK128_22150 [Viridibacillus sp. FSL H7-0596]|nr:hypothetical protein BK128_22150 [Viridibacillus sp. FSL H7-0596]
MTTISAFVEVISDFFRQSKYKEIVVLLRFFTQLFEIFYKNIIEFVFKVHSNFKRQLTIEWRLFYEKFTLEIIIYVLQRNLKVQF